MKKQLAVVFALLMIINASAVYAGGPLIIFDPFTRTPYAYPVGTVDVYTDLGNNGVLSNAVSNTNTAYGYAQWTGVATSYFSAAVVGDFASIGLPDIVGANAGLVVGTFNGGGIHVMYDNDGTITSNFFGAPPGVLGIASPDFSVTGSPELLESWAMINGSAADPTDVTGSGYSGVFTHEFGHTINLAHTQTNGAVGFFGDANSPGGCPAPYPGGFPPFAGFETMYPYLDPTPGSVGPDQAEINVLDDIAAISNIYATGGWPGAYGTITGRVIAPDGTEVTGVNVIARNVANQWIDATSELSGDYTQGDIGPDGLFTLNGLTPGADYIVYIDEIVAGGFSTPPVAIPGDGSEEYWNASESADPSVDPPCDYTFIAAVAGTPITADILVNGDPNDLGLGDDDYVEVSLPFSFEFCGVDYTSVFVNSNGSVTFGAGDTDFSESVPEFLAGAPRIAPLWDDLNPSAAGSITAMADGADFVISYNNIPEYPSTGGNNFQIVLHPDGTYEVNYGIVTGLDALVGRTEGMGAADPGETDLSTAAQPIGVGLSTVYQSFLGDFDLSEAMQAWGTCVIPDPPAIDVTPASLAAKLLPGESVTQTLTITNIGDLDLDFNILSDQLFAVTSPPTTAGMINPIDPAMHREEPGDVDDARLARLTQDRQASRVEKPDVSPYAVQLPHAFQLSLLNEDFNSGFPAGWTVVDNVALGVSWMVPQQGTSNATGGTGDAAGANSDFTGPADFDTELRTPPISGFGPNVVLTYVANYQNYANYDYLDVDVSTDGGATWSTVLSWNEDHGGFFGPPGEQVALDLDPFVAGASEFMVRWRYYDPSMFDWDWYAQVDDVMIVSDEPLTPCDYLSVSPTSGTLPGDGMADIDVTFDATGYAPGTYDCELVVFSNAVNEPRVSVPLQMNVAEEVTVDILPDKCPNVVKRHSNEGDHGDDDDDNNSTSPSGDGHAYGHLIEVVVLGSETVDVTGIDVASVTLGGVAPSSSMIRNRYSLDCGSHDDDDHGFGHHVKKCKYNGHDYSDACTQACRSYDGYKDLIMKFDPADIIDAIGAAPGELNEVTLCGLQTNGLYVMGSDCLIWKDNDDDDDGWGAVSLKQAALGPAQPNPFNPVTRISYYLPQEGLVKLTIYDVAGRLITSLVSDTRPQGEHTVEWDARGVASGIYFYRLEVGKFVETRKMILLK